MKHCVALATSCQSPHHDRKSRVWLLIPCLLSTTLLAPPLARTAQLPQSSGDPAAAARHRRTSCPPLRRPLSTSLPSRRHFIESGQAVRATSTSRATTSLPVLHAAPTARSLPPLIVRTNSAVSVSSTTQTDAASSRPLGLQTGGPSNSAVCPRRSLPATPSGTSAPATGCHQRHVHLTSCKYSKLWPHSRATQNPARHTRRCCHRPSLAQVLPAESSRHCCRNSRACNLTWQCPSTIVSNNPRGKSVDEPTTARIRRLRKLPKHARSPFQSRKRDHALRLRVIQESALPRYSCHALTRVGRRLNVDLLDLEPE